MSGFVRFLAEVRSDRFGGSLAFRPCHFLKVEYRSIVGLFKGSLEKSIIFGQTTTIPLIHTQQSSRFILRSEVLMSGFVRFLAEVRSDRQHPRSDHLRRLQSSLSLSLSLVTPFVMQIRLSRNRASTPYKMGLNVMQLRTSRIPFDQAVIYASCLSPTPYRGRSLSPCRCRDSHGGLSTLLLRIDSRA